MTHLKAFRISGTFPMGINKNQRFTREIASKDKKEAEEAVLSQLGSEHGVKRRMINISEIKEIKADDVTSSSVKQLIGGK